MSIPKLLFSHGMTADEIVDWNVSIGRITKQQARFIKQHESKVRWIN